MKKTKWMMLLLATVWASLLFGNTVMAEYKYNIYDIKPNTTVNLKNYLTLGPTYDDNYNEYRLVIPADGYIKVNMESAGDLSIDGFKHDRAYYARKGQKAIPILFKLDSEEFLNGRNTIPLSKGIYYFFASFSGMDTETRPFSYSFKKASFPANYCRAKAQTLKRGKKIEICQIPKKNYSRWFKIKLTKKQAITFWSDNGDHAAIFNENLERIGIKRAGEKSIKYSTVKKLPKGTYYLRMERCSSHLYPDDGEGYYTTLYWK